MAKKRDNFDPYESLSDIAVGALGFIVILVVLVVVISGGRISTLPSITRTISQANIDNSQINSDIKQKIEILSLQNAQMTIINNDDYKVKKTSLAEKQQKLAKEEQTMTALLKNVENLQAAIEKLEKLKSDELALKNADQKLRDKLLNAIKVHGTTIDNTGRPFLEYYTQTNSNGVGSYFIGDQYFDKDTFIDLLSSISYTEKDSFFIRFNPPKDRYNADTRPESWSIDFLAKNNWVPTRIKVKYGY